uniref:RRM domain-containing protein n=1 Tax=Ananas comosus var. bracteatus TaxID=296719 RepID=A0A6V7NVS0_ANACO|nr:unnamed protein product [Ananas comosus var. bracteatus]
MQQQQQQQQQRLKQQQQQALMQQALLLQQQQQSLYQHPSLLAIEPILSGNLPPGFDPTTCRSVCCNVHVQVTEALLQEVFQSTGPVEGCKLIRKEKVNLFFSNLLFIFGFVDYYDRRSAALAIMTLNGGNFNWAYASGQREDTSGHFNIFVGDLAPEVTDATLMHASLFILAARRSRGFGFVSFRNQQDAQSAINDLTGKWLGSRQIRCNWATKGASSNNEDKQSTDSKSVVELTNGSTDGQENANDDGPENNPQYTTVYVGNLAHEVTQLDLHRYFHSIGAGVIEEVRIQRDKGFGFVRFSNHAEAAMAIQMSNGRVLGGKAMKCSWGSKPTPPGTASNPLPLPQPPPALLPRRPLAAELLAYERTLAMSKMGSSQAVLMHHAQKQAAAAAAAAAMGMAGPAGAASQAIYDGGFQNVSATQQLMYY